MERLGSRVGKTKKVLAALRAESKFSFSLPTLPLERASAPAWPPLIIVLLDYWIGLTIPSEFAGLANCRSGI